MFAIAQWTDMLCMNSLLDCRVTVKTHTHARSRARAQTHTRTHALAHTITHAHTHAHMHTHTQSRTHTHTHARAHTHTHTHKLLSCTHSLTPITATRKLCASLALLVCSFITHNDLDDLIDVTRLAESPDLLSETNAGRADSHVSIGLCL